MELERAFRLFILAVATFAVLTIAQLARGEGWPTNYQHFNDIRSTVQRVPKWTHLRFTLNNGDIVYGEFLKYEKYNDYIWYQPQNTGHNWFKQDAFDVHEIATVEIVSPI